MTDQKISTVVTFYAHRDTTRAGDRDEDRAMGHECYYSGPSIDGARAALYVAMQSEADWLTRPYYRSAVSLRRAAEILDAADRVNTLAPASDDPQSSWSIDALEAAGIRWSIIRTVRPKPLG